MPKIAATTIKARVTKRFIRPPRLNVTPRSSAGARCSTVFPVFETARYPTKSLVTRKPRKTRGSGCD